MNSFDIMKILIQENPELINEIRLETQNQEELLKIAIENGFNGNINRVYKETNRLENKLLVTETAIMYQLDKGQKLNNSI